MRFLTIAAAAIATGGIGLAAPAHADSDDAFIQAISGDGISMDRKEAILQAHAVCLFLEQPGGASMWDAIQQVQGMHASWSVVSATHFVDRSIQNYCPDKAPTPSGSPAPSGGGRTVQQDCDAKKWPLPLPNAVGKTLEFLDDDPVLICLNIAAAIAPDGHDADNDPARDAQWWKITSMSPPAGTVVRKLNQLP